MGKRFRCRPVLRRHDSAPKFRSPFRVRKASFSLQTSAPSRKKEPNGLRRRAKVANRCLGVKWGIVFCRPVLRCHDSGPKFRSPFRVRKVSFSLRTGAPSRKKEPNGLRRRAKVAKRCRGVNWGWRVPGGSRGSQRVPKGVPKAPKRGPKRFHTGFQRFPKGARKGPQRVPEGIPKGPKRDPKGSQRDP